MYTCFVFFFVTDPVPTEIYTLSLHDALPISSRLWNCFTRVSPERSSCTSAAAISLRSSCSICSVMRSNVSNTLLSPIERSEEHTSELQSHSDLVCRLLLEKKKKKIQIILQRK